MSQTALNIVTAVPADIFETINGLGAKATGSARIVGGALAVILVAYLAWKVKFAIAGILMAGVAGVVFMFILKNIDNSDLQNTVRETVVPAKGFVSYRDLPPANAAGPCGRAGDLPSLPRPA